MAFRSSGEYFELRDRIHAVSFVKDLLFMFAELVKKTLTAAV